MKLFFLCISIGFAFLMDLLLQGHWIFAIIPTLMVCATCYWFWHIDLNNRLVLAFMVGFFLDSIYFFSFGTHLLLLFILAFAVEWMKIFLSRSESYVTEGMRIALMVIFFRLLITPVAIITKTIV